MNNIRNIEKINEEEFKLGIYGGLKKGSWHDEYKNSAWVFVGGLSFELSEGDVICVMSQWGEIEDIHLVRDKETQKPKGFAFVKYEDQKSTVLAVDNFNGVKLLGRTLRVDHVDQYKLPKEIKDEEIRKLEELEKGKNKVAGDGLPVRLEAGHAYRNKELANQYNIHKGVDVWKQPGEESESEEEREDEEKERDLVKAEGKKEHKHHNSEKKKKEKHKKKEKKHKKDKKRHHHDEEEEEKDRSLQRSAERDYRERGDSDDSDRERTAKKTKHDPPVKDEERLQEFKQIHEKHVIPYRSSLPEGVVASWRGVRDPEIHRTAEAFELKRQQEEYQQKQKEMFPIKSETKGEEIKGIGGYNRRR